MEIQKIVSDSGIRPADIEKMTGGEIRLPQASVMIKKALAGGAGLSATTRWFLCLASQAHSISQSILAAGSSELRSYGGRPDVSVEWPKESITDKMRESLIERAAPAVESNRESWMRIKEAVKKLPSTPPKDTKKSVTEPEKVEETPPSAWRTGDSWAVEGRFFKTGSASNRMPTKRAGNMKRRSC